MDVGANCKITEKILEELYAKQFRLSCVGSYNCDIIRNYINNLGIKGLVIEEFDTNTCKSTDSISVGNLIITRFIFQILEEEGETFLEIALDDQDGILNGVGPYTYEWIYNPEYFTPLNGINESFLRLSINPGNILEYIYPQFTLNLTDSRKLSATKTCTLYYTEPQCGNSFQGCANAKNFVYVVDYDNHTIQFTWNTDNLQGNTLFESQWLQKLVVGGGNVIYGPIEIFNENLTNSYSYDYIAAELLPNRLYRFKHTTKCLNNEFRDAQSGEQDFIYFAPINNTIAPKITTARAYIEVLDEPFTEVEVTIKDAATNLIIFSERHPFAAMIGDTFYGTGMFVDIDGLEEDTDYILELGLIMILNGVEVNSKNFGVNTTTNFSTFVQCYPAQNITLTPYPESIELDWDPNISIINISYKKRSETNYVLANNDAEPVYEILGLSPNTLYDVKITTLCGYEDIDIILSTTTLPLPNVAPVINDVILLNSCV